MQRTESVACTTLAGRCQPNITISGHLTLPPGLKPLHSYLDFRQGTPRGAERPCSLTGLEHQLVIQVDKSESGMGKQ